MPHRGGGVLNSSQDPPLPTSLCREQPKPGFLASVLLHPHTLPVKAVPTDRPQILLSSWIASPQLPPSLREAAEGGEHKILSRRAPAALPSFLPWGDRWPAQGEQG